MSDDERAASDAVRELERQVERGNLFAHTALTDQLVRTNEQAALLSGLIDYLIQQGVVQPAELKAVVEAVRAEAVERREVATLGVAIRVDGEAGGRPPVAVNCAERLHICQAVCCRLHFALTVEEIETGRMKWDLGKPYLNRQLQHGYCHQIDPDRKCCRIYADRPAVCRGYSCAGDGRIWKDFDAMELNQEWIDAHLNTNDLGLVEVFMDR
jgi:Fe-S-cluster containining protein